MAKHTNQTVAATNVATDLKKKTRRRKVKKDPKHPKRASTAYILFCNKKRRAVTARLAEKAEAAGDPKLGSITEVTREFGRMWREDVSDEEKATFKALAEQDKVRYAEEMKSYVPTKTDE